MKTKMLVVAAMLFMVALVASTINGSAQQGTTYAGVTYPPGVRVTVIEAVPVENGEAAAIAAGALRIGNCPPASIPTPQASAPAGPTYGFQGQQANCPAPQPQVIMVKEKRRTWLGRCFSSVGLFFRAEGGLSMAPSYRYGHHWELNDDAYEARYYGLNYPDQVFSWGWAPGYSTVNSSSYTYVDNYRSGPYPPVRFIPDTPRGQPVPHYQPHPSQRPGPRPNPQPHQGGGRSGQGSGHGSQGQR